MSHSFKYYRRKYIQLNGQNNNKGKVREEQLYRDMKGALNTFLVFEE